MKKYKVVTYLITSVWFVNGLFCKVLNLVPRHQEIVARILNEEYSRALTFTIGILEIFMTVWILSGFKSRLNSITQIAVIILMNIIEFFFAGDLLLFGKLNILFALFFSSIIFYNEFILKNRSYV